MGAKIVEMFPRKDPLCEAVNNMMVSHYHHGVKASKEEELNTADVAMFHARVLQDSLRCLNHESTTAKEQADALVWIANGLFKYTDSEAFSFRNCCRWSNNVDPQQIQSIVDLISEPMPAPPKQTQTVLAFYGESTDKTDDSQQAQPDEEKSVESSKAPEATEDPRQIQYIVNLGVEPAALALRLIRQEVKLFTSAFGAENTRQLEERAERMAEEAQDANPLKVYAC